MKTVLYCTLRDTQLTLLYISLYIQYASSSHLSSIVKHKIELPYVSSLQFAYFT